MPTAGTHVRRKSLHRRKNCAHAKHRANQRAAKERIRLDRAARDYDHAPEIAEAVRCAASVSTKALRFRVTVECLSDGAKASFTTAEGPHGLTISPTLAGRRVAAVLMHYRPAKAD